jgi:hypothetical protein
MVTQVGYSVAQQSRGRVTLCAVCTVHMEMRSVGYLVEPRNQGRRFVSGLTSKPMAMIFSSLASKPVASVFSGLASKPVATVVPGLASKPVVDFLVEPQNQGGGGFPGLGLKTSRYGLVGFLVCLKNWGGATAGGARGTITEAGSRSS